MVGNAAPAVYRDRCHQLAMIKKKNWSSIYEVDDFRILSLSSMIFSFALCSRLDHCPSQSPIDLQFQVR